MWRQNRAQSTRRERVDVAMRQSTVNTQEACCCGTRETVQVVARFQGCSSITREAYCRLACMQGTPPSRWKPETHTFVFSVGEVTVTLKDVAHIFGLPIDGESVSGWTDSSKDFLQSQSIAIFDREPEISCSTYQRRRAIGH
ncbi:hypothetical protein AHAS_Ahas19G0293300 [Arachis hypogaea]